jgi:cobalt transporter subunit CbtB
MMSAPGFSQAKPLALPVTQTLPWLLGAVVFGLLLYYFIGIDEGATSVFGNSMVVHEFVHDSRHFLGFPCH